MTIETVAFGHEADNRLRSQVGAIVMGLIDGSLGPFRYNGNPGELVRTDSLGREILGTATPDTIEEATAAFARSNDRRLFVSMWGEAFGEHTGVTVNA